MFKNKNSVVFGCFSPPVMIATFLFEFLSLIYVFIRYRLNTDSRIVLALLLNLSTFQLAEYMVCENSAAAMVSARIGYLAITFLPVLGLHLMSRLSKTKISLFLKIAYLLAFAISMYFLFAPNSFDAYECTGNYVIFQIGQVQAWLYSAYYFGLIIGTICLGLMKTKKATKTVRRNIYWLIAGYVLFILPVAIITITHPDSRRAVPSILCGFAVLFAVVLVAKISPRILKKR